MATIAHWRYFLISFASLLLNSVAINSALAQPCDGEACPPGKHCVFPNGIDKPGHCIKDSPTPSTIFVDWQNSGLQDGTAAHPYRTLPPALVSAAPRDMIVIRAGNYNRPPNPVNKPLTLRADNGPVIIGRRNLDVVTHHYDNGRTGWNSHEIALNSVNVNPSRFGLLHTVALDEKVSAQPLVVLDQFIMGMGAHDVVYVVTEANTVYAIDARDGSVLKSRNIGQAVSNSLIGCGDNGPLQGITSTPLIDTDNNGMYLISFVMNSKPVHRLHLIDLSTLNDKVSPVTVSGSHALSDGTAYSFSSQVTRQRAGLVKANGNIYAAFASHCDHNADQSRGWLLGWNATTLAPLPANDLENRIHPYPFSGDSPFFLTSIWMSGFGVASDSAGSLYAVTGNTGARDLSGSGTCNPSISTFNFPNNLSESAVKVSADLTRVLGAFTPDNFAFLDCTDNDFGSGGIMLLPDQPGLLPRLAVVAGKEGNMFLLNRDSMRNISTYAVGPCWCGPSYFMGSDGLSRIVTSGGNNLKIWRLATSGGGPSLVEEASTPIANGQDGGFFTSVSSNSTDANSVIIWAVARPVAFNSPLLLYAFDSKGNQLYEHPAGQWNLKGGVAYSMPVSSNGRVYVGSNRELAIFGLGSVFQEIRPLTVAQGGPHIAVAGSVTAIEGSMITVRKPNGTTTKVDISKALASKKTVPLSIGKKIAVQGVPNAQGVVEAESISHGEAVLE